MKKVTLLLAGISIAATFSIAQTKCRSLGTGVTADLGTTTNWLVNTGSGWTAATTAPGLNTALGTLDSIVIAAGDSWANNIATAVTLRAGVTLIDSSAAALGTFKVDANNNRFKTELGSKILFAAAAAQSFPAATAFVGGTSGTSSAYINSDIEIDNPSGVATTTGSINVLGNLILTSGVLSTNTGGGSFFYRGNSITRTNGSIYVGGYFGWYGTYPQTIPDGIYSTTSGVINNSVAHLRINNTGGSVTTSGPLTVTSNLYLDAGTLILGGNLYINSGNNSLTYSVTSGTLSAGDDTVIVQKSGGTAAVQALPSGFFENGTIRNLWLKNPSGVTYGAALTLDKSLTLDSLSTATAALTVSGAASISSGNALVVKSFKPAPTTFPATYTIVSSTGALGGTFASVVLPNGYTGTVAYTANATVLTVSQEVTTPVKISGFKAVYGKPNVQLSWHSGVEENLKAFDILRSADGVAFQSIGSVAAKGSNNTYGFVDENPLEGTSYYKLNAVDYDCSALYSPTVSISTKSTASQSLSIYPNPANGNYISFKHNMAGKEANVKIVAVDGSIKTAITVTIGETVSRVNIDNLAKGIYFLYYNDGLVAQKATFVKQ